MEKVCVCGRTLEQFYKTGMLGCPKCYETFEKEIDATLDKIQHGPRHVGKKPYIDEESKRLLAEYRELMERKQKATFEKRFAEMTEISLRMNEIIPILKEKGLL